MIIKSQIFYSTIKNFTNWINQKNPQDPFGYDPRTTRWENVNVIVFNNLFFFFCGIFNKVGQEHLESNSMAQEFFKEGWLVLGNWLKIST